MRLYSGTSEQFLQDTIQNQIAEKLRESFFNHFHYYPSPSEMNSWRNSLRALSLVFMNAGLRDHGVLLEYQLPSTSKRLDCMVTGRNDNGEEHAIIIELKQWDKCEESNGDNEVVTWVGGAKRDVLHPSAQVGFYQMYLQDTHTAFYEGDDYVRLSSCSYLHNYPYNENDVIFAPKFQNLLHEFPIFTEDDVNKLTQFLRSKLSKGNGVDVLRKIENSKYRPSKKLMDHVGNTIKGKKEYVLLDNQRIIYDKVFAFAREGFHDKHKQVVIVKGGPGTGKSVIALNLLADLSLQGYNTHYATGSRAFTETLRSIIGRRGSVQFKYFNSYTEAEYNEIDVLICDEAHRIRKTSNNRFTKKEKRSDIPQIAEIINAAKVSVFFIDDNQVVRPDEIGSVAYITKYALENGCKVYIEELDAQFRCNGSEGFINWINNTLGIRQTANVLWDVNDSFEFKIFDSPFTLEQAIREKAAQGYSARLTAGFCWPWSKSPKPDGTLENDVVIGDFKRPWNARPEATKLAEGIPKATLWAHDPNGINQIGCIYTAQGFEFDYVGVIFGTDLTYNLDEQKWEGHKENSYDTTVKRSKEKFIDLVKNTYRVLLTSGMKGCYVYFMDKDTERFFKSRIQYQSTTGVGQVAEEGVEY
jgi:uncharacterized protein